jgi:putative hydroxymethylpyrimidine transport system permease protein
MPSKIVHGIGITLLLLATWQGVVWLTGVPRFLLPSPLQVLPLLWREPGYFWPHLQATMLETVCGFLLGVVIALLTAALLTLHAWARAWLLPLVIISQVLPLFALAPLLVLWAGYGLWSKVIMAAMIVYFPVLSAFYDGLRQTPPAYRELATVSGASRLRTFWYLQCPAALPALASGLRMAAVFAPMGAILGEWVGASQGLGYLMLQANGRVQTAHLFAALVLLSLFALVLYFSIDALLRRLIFWKPLV